MSSLPTSTNDRKAQIEAIHGWLTHLYAVYIDDTFFRTRDRAGTVLGSNKQGEHVSAHAIQNLIAAMKDKSMQQKFTRLMGVLSNVGLMYEQWFQNHKDSLHSSIQTKMSTQLEDINDRVSQIFELIKADWKHILSNEMMINILKRLNLGAENSEEGRLLIERNQLLNERTMAGMLTFLVSAFKYEQNHLAHAAFKRISGHTASSGEGAIIKKSVPALEKVNEQLRINPRTRVNIKNILDNIDNLFFYPRIDQQSLTSSTKLGVRNNNISDLALVSAMHLYLMMEAYENLFSTDAKGEPSELWVKLETGFLERRRKAWNLTPDEFKLFQEEFNKNIIMFDVKNSADNADYESFTAADAKSASEPKKTRAAAREAMQKIKQKFANSPSDPEPNEYVGDEDYKPSEESDANMDDAGDSKDNAEGVAMSDNDNEEDMYLSPETRRWYEALMKMPPPPNPEVVDVQRALAEANAELEKRSMLLQQRDQEIRQRDHSATL